MPAAFAWSSWNPFPGLYCPDAVSLAETLDGGQAFRWRYDLATTSWTGLWGKTVVELRREDPGILFWRSPVGREAATRSELEIYFSVDRDWAALFDGLPWRSDAHLARCLTAYPSLRILRQPFGETLLGFLCSATKQILQIKQMMALLAERHGAEIVPGVNRLPTWPELAHVPEAELRACLLGFRARYIHETALFLQDHPDWLETTAAAPYANAKERLCRLPGVGEKVADCVLLFGGGYLDAFPVDVWVLRALAERYGLTGWKPAQVAHFGRVHFGPQAGLAQQFVFAWERRHGKSAPPSISG